MKVSTQKNEEKKIILYLYLLHHPDHGYSIAKEFSDAKTSGNWNKNRYSDLTNYKVYTTLKQMLSEKTVSAKKTAEATDTAKDKKNRYHPSPEFILKREDNKKKDGDLTTLFEAFIEYLPKVSPDKQRCIKEISSIKKYDNLTIPCYMKKLLRETIELNNLTQPKTMAGEKHPGFGELDMMNKLSTEIIKTKKSPPFMKPLGQRETNHFFREELAKKGFPTHENDLARLFGEAEKRIDEYIIEYSYGDRIPTKN